jgi:actin-related protein 2
MAEPAIILDNGSGYLKAGLSNIENPMDALAEKQILIMPSLIGCTLSRNTEKIGNIELKPIMIGDEVIPFRSLLNLNYPMKNGNIENKDDMSLLWDYCIRKNLGIKGDLKDRKILLTETPKNSNENKERMGELVFEKLGFGYFNIEPQPKLNLLCEGLETGIVLDCGDHFTNCVPVAETFIFHHNIKTSETAGRHITDYLIKLLHTKGNPLYQIVDFEFAREMKEKYCFISCDINSDRILDEKTTYYNSIHKLPDGRKIKISSEKFEAPEILFNPPNSYLNQNVQGIHEMVYDVINVNIYFI